MKLPILTYHRLSRGNEGNRYTVREDEFLRQLDFLSTNNYRCILVDEYYRLFLNQRSKLPRNHVIITFDDGDESNFHIGLEILKKCNFKATFFITTDFIGKTGYMNPEQIKTLKGEGMSVQSHAKTHRFLDGISSSDIYNELKESKEKLEQILESDVPFISMPGGRYNRKVINCAKELKYKALFSSAPFQIKNIDGFYLIGRTMITQSQNSNIFYNTINMGSFNIIKARVSYMAKILLKNAFGNKLYYFLWKKYNVSQINN
jgi:peptidoglycan/xylan/chitin deacetylase (PgdA/CDA1 family)